MGEIKDMVTLEHQCLLLHQRTPITAGAVRPRGNHIKVFGPVSTAGALCPKTRGGTGAGIREQRFTQEHEPFMRPAFYSVMLSRAEIGLKIALCEDTFFPGFSTPIVPSRAEFALQLFGPSQRQGFLNDGAFFPSAR